MPKKATTTTEKTGKTEADIVKKVVEQFSVSWSFAKKRHPIWERNWKLYNNQRVMRSYQGGITDTFIPLSNSIVETLTAALGAGKPSTDFVPQDMYKYILAYAATQKKPDLKALNAQYDYYWDCDGWDLKSVKTIRGTFIYGTACEWVYWDSDKPRLINLNVRDAIIDPALVDPMQLWSNPNDFFTGRRYLTKLDALKAEAIVDPETGKEKARFKNLNKVQPGTTGSEQLDKELKESMYIGAAGDTSELVEVIEIWDGKKIRSVANRTILIEDRDNRLGIHCLVIHRFIPDESMIHGKAIIDIIYKQQEYLNDLANQRMDAVTDVLLPERELDPTYADYIDKIESGSFGTVYPFAPGSLQIIKKGNVPFEAFKEADTIKDEMREAAGADQIVQGQQATGDATATEIQAQLNQAGQRFELYVRMLEQEAFKQRAKIVYRMMREYVTDMTLVPQMTMSGPQFRQYDPAQYTDDYEPKVQLEATVKGAKARASQQSTEDYSVIIQDPTNDLWEAKKVMYPKMFDLDEEQLDRIIGAEKPQELTPEAEGDMPVDEGMPMEAPLEELPPEGALL